MEQMKTFAVCILAHNEERFIERTINAILNTTQLKDFSITVYANGCTDKTYQIAKYLSLKNKNIKVLDIAIPSKVNAWNVAFNEHDEDVLIFCDGDVVPEKNAVFQLLQDLNQNEEVVISSTRLFPLTYGTNFERLFVGFMQLPLKHEFLSGGMYAVKRKKLKAKLQARNLSGIPAGVTGEDYFLERLITPKEFYISACQNFYEPPTLKDYVRYLARIKWQTEQMEMVLGPNRDLEMPKAKLILRKLTGHKNILYLFFSIPAVGLRLLFKTINSRKINRVYRELGPVVLNGEAVLTKATRSHSTK
jgi:glycosyltransferase involved in cell wall biosynthesis